MFTNLVGYLIIAQSVDIPLINCLVRFSIKIIKWLNLGFFTMQDSLIFHNTEITLEHVLKIMEELTQWLVRSGIGHTDFSAALRPLFYNEAILELERIQQKKTDSSISLLAGLNRKDVSQIRQQAPDGNHQIIKNIPSSNTMNVPARVVGLWLGQQLPKTIPFSGSEISFEKLVKHISTEKHPRSILSELKRLGIVEELDTDVVLCADSFTPSPQADEIKQIFVSNIKNHLAAGIHNILEKDDKFLEQAITANELTEKSVRELRALSVSLWSEMSQKILEKAVDCCIQDEGRADAQLHFSLGIFDFEKICL